MEVMATAVSNDMCSNNTEVPLAFANTEKAAAVESATDKNFAGDIPSSHVETPTKSPQKGISTVDSALLCAMRDSRERHALLRLEQTLILFMREETTGYIEVGGACNSIILSPSGNIGQKAPVDGAGVPTTGRQTSFQRCWLHRLADRFGIVRETNVDGMIRLVKVKESSIPSQLLIDLDPSEYEIESPDVVRGLAAKLSDTSLGTSNRPQKMKIMKRSSSGLSGSSNSLKSEGGKGSSARRKRLSDKEKAYAEARARIFNEQKASSGGGTGIDYDTIVPSQAMERMTSTSSLPVEQPTSATPPPAVEQSESEDGKNVNKATYRNRQQEAADPDFQRLHSMQQYGGTDAYIPQQAQAPAPFAGYNPNAPQFIPSSAQSYSYPQQQQYSYVADGETYYPSARPTYGRQLSQTSSTDGNAADVNSLQEFPSLG